MMQVRPIEFQESFARVPVEQARQQHVLQREPDLGRDQVARAAADERLLELSRPVPVAEPDADSVVVDPERQQSFEQRAQNGEQDRQSDEQPESARRPVEESRGTRIDLIA
jgi:hypothetical protein